jgi:hypothetical protein
MVLARPRGENGWPAHAKGARRGTVTTSWPRVRRRGGVADSGSPVDYVGGGLHYAHRGYMGDSPGKGKGTVSHRVGVNGGAARVAVRDGGGGVPPTAMAVVRSSNIIRGWVR